MTTLGFKSEVNLNTVVVIIGFLGTFAGIITLWNSNQYKLDENSRRIDAHDVIFKGMGERFDAIDKRDADTRDLQFRVGALEKGQEGVDTRISRIVESYGNQFTDIRGTLSAISTQVALVNQSLQRIEALGKTPPELKN